MRPTGVPATTARAISYGYDGASRLSSHSDDLAGTASDRTVTFSYNPASQIIGLTRSNDSYAWTNAVAVNRSYTTNGLNQYSAAGPASFTYDARGNLTSDGSVSFSYDSENKLTSAAGAMSASLGYDPTMRLYQLAGTSTTRFAYDRADAIAEYSGTNALLRRFVFGPEDDEPLVQYEGAGLTSRRFLHADERGSIVAVSDSAGANLTINRFDEYGIPAPTNAGRFQYTGQMWLAELGLYHYKARAYSPSLGRFRQTDPIGYEDGINWYAYTGNDPVNGADPKGMYTCQPGSEKQCDVIDSGMKDARAAARTLPLGERVAVMEAVRSFGSRGTENGVTVYASPNVEAMSTATLSSKSTLVAVNSGITSANQLRKQGINPAGMVVHEGSHIYEGRTTLRGRNWETYTPMERLRLERQAYSLQGRIDRSMRFSGKGYTPLWKQGMTDHQMKLNAYRYAYQGAECTREACGNMWDE